MLTREWFEMDIPPEILAALNKKSSVTASASSSTLPNPPTPPSSSTILDLQPSAPPDPPIPTIENQDNNLNENSSIYSDQNGVPIHNPPSSYPSYVTVEVGDEKISNHSTSNHHSNNSSVGVGGAGFEYETPQFHYSSSNYRHPPHHHDDRPMMPNTSKTTTIAPAPNTLQIEEQKQLKNQGQVVVTNHLCDICGLVLGSKLTLRRHKLLHTRPFRCDRCPKTFLTPNTFASHQRQVHDSPSEAKINLPVSVGEDEANQLMEEGVEVDMDEEEEELMVEVNEEDDEEDEEEEEEEQKIKVEAEEKKIKSEQGSSKIPKRNILYGCRFCSKKFLCKKDRQAHIRYHTVDKPFECSKCHKLFTRPDHLVRHLLIHSGEKPFKCSQCSGSFNQRAYLEKHVRRIHR